MMMEKRRSCYDNSPDIGRGMGERHIEKQDRKNKEFEMNITSDEEKINV